MTNPVVKVGGSMMVEGAEATILGVTRLHTETALRKGGDITDLSAYIPVYRLRIRFADGRERENTFALDPAVMSVECGGAQGDD